jgi:uncharacterized repeat protein (TIGR01451 family)
VTARFGTLPPRSTPTGDTAAPRSGEPKLAVTVRGDRKSSEPGQRVTFLVKTANTGTAAADEVSTCVTVPARFVIVSLDGGTLSGRRVCWSNASLASGASATRRLGLRVLSAAAAPSDVTLHATAAASNAKRAKGKAKVAVSARPSRAEGVTG